MKGGSVIKLKVKKGTNALLVRAPDELDEGEILFGRKNVIRVTKVTENGYEGEIYYE